ncbi:MAG: N-acetyl-gamma-glutamyl-phosphate reductase [Deltaproteobacteria bacterium]|nr:N-acetyl-gamma-glutamyl-phosphate reductase [Deltaproteobacteria bacterium]
MINIAILGASGYTGFELLRILANHPNARITEATSRQYKGKTVPDVFPSLRGFYDGLVFSDPEDFKRIRVDAVFSALPHGASQEVVPALLEADNRVIDLSADFRLRDDSVYRAWYGEHKADFLLKEAVYGLPELYREPIKDALLVANPGCYPTGAILALSPLLKEGLIDTDSVIVDSKSGVSGAGRGANLDTSYVEVSSGFKAYKVGSHRHAPEIEQELSVQAGVPVSVTFTPHLIPASRGILSTAYANLKKSVATAELHNIYAESYGKEPFVRVLPEGKFPDISQVRGSNFCDIGLFADGKRKKVIVVSAIDNLVKGASGQAVQNMNIMYWLKEDTALNLPPISI